MSANAIGVGVLGFAHGHVGSYCTAWRKDESLGVRVVAGWDHDAARAAKAHDSYGVRLASSQSDLLAQPDVAAVVIGAETSLHAELVEQAAEAGKAIIVQKPLALTVEQADRIVAAVARTGVPFTIAWQMRVDPQNVQMKELVRAGSLGRLFMLRRRHTLSTHTWPDFEKTWHVAPQFNRDIWADDASHPIDLVYWMLGAPASVTAELGSLHNPKIPNDNGVAIFRYADGTFAEVCCSFTCLAGENTTEIIAANGLVIQSYGDGPSAAAPRPAGAVGLKWLMRGDKQWTVSKIASPAGQGDRIAGLAGPLAEFLHGRRPPIATAEEGRDVLKMTLACYESAEQGRRVMLR
ncbi:MAG: Gfo/Idh/MocA family oxidoreductase [Phycisphaerae bacterium]|nr:Gfo/Idh/MocA family oxidoreductase [Phycisphaerae bacterium]